MTKWYENLPTNDQGFVTLAARAALEALEPEQSLKSVLDPLFERFISNKADRRAQIVPGLALATLSAWCERADSSLEAGQANDHKIGVSLDWLRKAWKKLPVVEAGTRELDFLYTRETIIGLAASLWAPDSQTLASKSCFVFLVDHAGLDPKVGKAVSAAIWSRIFNETGDESFAVNPKVEDIEYWFHMAIGSHCESILPTLAAARAKIGGIGLAVADAEVAAKKYRGK